MNEILPYLQAGYVVIIESGEAHIEHTESILNKTPRLKIDKQLALRMILYGALRVHKSSGNGEPAKFVLPKFRQPRT